MKECLGVHLLIEGPGKEQPEIRQEDIKLSQTSFLRFSPEISSSTAFGQEVVFFSSLQSFLGGSDGKDLPAKRET